MDTDKLYRFELKPDDRGFTSYNSYKLFFKKIGNELFSYSTDEYDSKSQKKIAVYMHKSINWQSMTLTSITNSSELGWAWFHKLQPDLSRFFADNINSTGKITNVQ